MIQSFIQSIKTYLTGMPKSALAIAGIGVCSLVVAIIIVAGNNQNAPASVRSVSNAAKTSDVMSQSAGSTNTAGEPNQATAAGTSGHPAGSSANPNNSGNSSVASNTTGSAKAANGTQSTASSTSNPKPSNPASTPSTPKADYNLNENWYISTVGVAGIFNSCWPTPLSQDNEATCGDLNSPYTNVLFEGIGVSKNPDTAYTLAADNAQQKAEAQHVDVRRGGGGDPAILTEGLCSQYGLSCARW